MVIFEFLFSGKNQACNCTFKEKATSCKWSILCRSQIQVGIQRCIEDDTVVQLHLYIADQYLLVLPQQCIEATWLKHAKPP